MTDDTTALQAIEAEIGALQVARGVVRCATPGCTHVIDTAPAAVERRGRQLVFLLPEVARLSKLSLSSIRWLDQVGKLKTIKLGRRRAVRRADLAAFLQVAIEELP